MEEAVVTPNVGFMETDVIAETPDSAESFLSPPQGRCESIQWLGHTFNNALMLSTEND